MRTTFLGFKAYETQAFATFKYMQIEFDFVCDLDIRRNWRILEDEQVQKMHKILNVEKLINSCMPVLRNIDSCLFDKP